MRKEILLLLVFISCLDFVHLKKVTKSPSSKTETTEKTSSITSSGTSIPTITSTTTTSSTTVQTEFESINVFSAWENNIRQTHPECFRGDERSPINIDIVNAVPIQYDPLQFINYNSTGHVRQRKYENFTESIFGFHLWKKRPLLSGGGLPFSYYLSDIHWAVSEWGSHSLINNGHTFNGAQHYMEAHFVHVREGFRLEEARNRPGHVAIVAVFFELIVNTTNRARKNRDMLNLDRPLFQKNGADEPYDFIAPEVLLPTDTSSFYRYNGSFVHPPCSSGVIWTLLIHPVVISHLQLHYFYIFSSKSSSSLPISHLIDEKPAVNDRTVYLNYGKQPSSAVSRFLNYSRQNSFSLAVTVLALVLVACLIFPFCYHRCSQPRVIRAFDNIAMSDCIDMDDTK